MYARFNPWAKYPTNNEADYQANKAWFDHLASLGVYDDDAIENDDDDDDDDDDEDDEDGGSRMYGVVKE